MAKTPKPDKKSLTPNVDKYIKEQRATPDPERTQRLPALKPAEKWLTDTEIE